MNKLYAGLAGIALILLAFGGGVWYGHADGVGDERLTWQTRETSELMAANAKILELEAKYRAAEAEATKAMIDINDRLDKENADALAQKDRALADLREHNNRLRVHLAASEDARRSAEAQAAAGADSGDGAACTGFLDDADAAFLVAEAARADTVARQLGAAQDVIRAIVKACGG
jgi:hypothetical protein